MVYKDLEGTKQARKELAEKESKVLQSLQGGKGAEPKAKPIIIDMITTSYEDYTQFKSMFTQLEADDEIIVSSIKYLVPKYLLVKHTVLSIYDFCKFDSWFGTNACMICWWLFRVF